jgi:DNA end-binding protein Ku
MAKSRAIWSGSIVFGLVNIPIKIHTAVRDQSIHLHMVSKEGDCRLRRKLYCPDTGKEYDFHETARGYEVAPGQYVLIEEEEIEQVKPESGHTIDILDFVDLDQIDPMYFDNTYYVGPDKSAGKGYALLVQALKHKNKAGVAKVIMREKEYLVALRAHDDVLLMETMHFADEIVPAEKAIEKPPSARLDKRELAMAEKLIDAMVRDFEPQRYKEEYRERLRELIERKAEGKEVLIEEKPEPEEGRTLNFMKALEESLKSAKGQAGARTGARSGKGAAAAHRRTKPAAHAHAAARRRRKSA